jgi:hypothetical protein
MTKWSEAELNSAHKYSFKNEASIKSSYICGCFCCFSIYKSSIISSESIIPESDGVGTVWCPECGIDSVIGDSVGFRITLGFLHAMGAYYFSFKYGPWDPDVDYDY